MIEVVRLEAWDQASQAYEFALSEQKRLTSEGRSGWLLFTCAPTITCGKRASATDVLVARAELERQGVTLLEVDRGGQVTYHGPGQLVGFAFGTLADHVGDARGVREFVDRLKTRLERVVAEYKKLAPRQEDEANVGIWIDEGAGRSSKIVSIGLGFGRQGIRHGFAINVDARVSRGFGLINPCGESGARVGWLLEGESPATRAQLERVLAAIEKSLKADS